jgi:hypothetical protein
VLALETAYKLKCLSEPNIESSARTLTPGINRRAARLDWQFENFFSVGTVVATMAASTGDCHDELLAVFR